MLDPSPYIIPKGRVRATGSVFYLVRHILLESTLKSLHQCFCYEDLARTRLGVFKPTPSSANKPLRTILRGLGICLGASSGERPTRPCDEIQLTMTVSMAGPGDGGRIRGEDGSHGVPPLFRAASEQRLPEPVTAATTTSGRRSTSTSPSTSTSRRRAEAWWSIHPFRGMVNDVRRRAPYYVSDWLDAWDYRVVPATIFMYFAKYVIWPLPIPWVLRQ